MRSKFKLSNRILSLVLAFVMVLGMMPTVVLAASTPEYHESITLDGALRPAVYAKGTDLIIEAGSNGTTSVYYMNGNTKTAVVENTDLSNAYIFAGYESSSSKLTDNVTITMNGGSVASILVGHTSSGSVTGNVTIIMKESAQVNAVLPSSASGPTTVNGKLRIFAANGRYGGTVSGRSFDGQIVKTSSGWSVSGDAVVPEGCTMTIDSGTTVTVASGTTLTNNGTILNNGTIHLQKSFTQLQGNAPTGSGSYIVNLPYVANASAVTAASVDCVAVESPSYKALGGKLYLDVPQGKVWATVDGKEYYCDFGGAETAMQPYTSVTNIGGIPTSVNANTSTTLAPTVQPDGALTQSFTYAITDAGTTGASLSGSTLTAPFGGTIGLRVTATDGYRSFSKTYSIAVNQVAVTGIANDSVIPASAEPSSITLPTQVTPSNATYQKITWTVSGPATVSGSTLKLSGAGTVALTATVKNGLGNGQDYTQTYTISVSAPTELNIEYGEIYIWEDSDGNGHKVSYYNASGQQQTQVYAADKLIVITGTTTENYVTIQSGSPKLVLKNCSIQLTKYQAIYISSDVPAVEITLEGENTLEAGTGLYVPEGTTLTIDGSGSLTATGNGGPGIGSGSNNASGTIIINGGTVNATGTSANGSGYAGIGSGGGYDSGEIIINGGTVNATGSDGAAGIGGGYNGSGTVTIYGGTITATGGSSGAGIGGGAYGSGTVTIYGGTVEANGGEDAAGIGGGYYYNANEVIAANVTITDGTVTATGGDNGAGIGGGYKGIANITISGGTVNARTGTDNTSGAAGIGCGYDGSGAFSIIISGGTVDAIGHYNAAGIGGSYRSKKGSVTISGGKITATGGSYAASAIGGGYSGDVAVNISGGTITAQTNYEHGDSVGNGTVTITGGSLKVNTTVNAPTNGEANGSQEVAVKELTIDRLAADETITSVAGLPGYYGLNDVQTMDGKLYFYLPGGYPESITINGDDTYYHAGNGLYTDHQHRCSYSVNEAGDTITATCTASDCPNPDCGSVTISAPSDLTYTGSKIEAVVDNTLTTGATVNVEYTGNTTDGYPVNAGEYVAKITLDGKEISVTYSITAASISDANVAVGGTFTYDGTAKEPTDITVTLGGNTLTKDTDYTVSYSDNVNAGTAKVTVTGKGNYQDTAEGTFTITDETDPTGEIKIGENGWKIFISQITFGLFFKENVDVTVTADGTGSDVAKVEYLFSFPALEENKMPADGWTEVTGSDGTYKFSIQPQNKGAVYVRITDEGGNATLINSDGIVVYTDPEAETESVSTTYMAGESKNITVKLNGNNVKSVFRGGTELTAGNDYSADTNGTITLKSDYLDTLSVGAYTFTVSYNPQGVVTDKVTVTTTFTVTVEKADGKVSNINISGKTYDGTAVTAPTFDKLGDGETTVEYKLKGADDSTYTKTAPKNAGDYVVRVTVAEGTNYKESSATAEFTISKAAPTAQNFTWYDNIYATYNGQTHEINVVFFNDEGKYSGMGDITVKYYDENVTPLTEAPKNAGAYTFKIDVAEGANYDAATDITGNGWSLLISRRSVMIIPDAVTKTYGEADPTLTYTVDGAGLVNGETLTGSLSREAGESVGSYAITLGTITQSDNPNYSISLQPDVNFIITKASYDMSGAKWNYTEAYNYDGTEKTVEVIGLPDGVTVSGYVDNKKTAVGDYTAKVTFNYDSVNYNAPILADCNWSIKNDWIPTEYTVSAPNTNGWMNDTFAITAAEGYKVSLTNTADGVWKDMLTYTAETDNGEVTFYLHKANGEISLAKTVTYKIDKTPATGKVEFVERTGWEEFINNITFGLFYKDEVTVKITADDTHSGVASVEYYAAAKAMNLDEVKAINDWTAYNDSFGVSVEDTKQFVYFVRMIDNAGNVTYLSTDGAEYDTTAPVISGVENGKTYYTTQKVTVTDKNIESITLNGETAEANITLDGNKEATYTIVATDKAGNSTTVTVTMKTISDLSAPIDNLTKDNVNSSSEQTVDEVKAAAAAVDTTNATEAEKEALKAITDKAAELEKVIDDTKSEIARINEELNKYDGDTVNSDNAAALEQLAKDIKDLTDGGNLTDAERTALTEDAGDVQEMQKTVADTVAENNRISDAVDSYDLATVTSEDEADLEQLLADISKQLESTNLTDDEISELNGEKKAVEDLLTKIKGTDELIDKLTVDTDGYSEDTVKSTDKAAIEQIIEDIDALLDTGNLTEAEEKALEDAKAKAEGLLVTIEEAAGATETENTDKVGDVTAENVTPENKTDLENAKADLEKALEDNGDNYTDDEKKAIEDEIKKIDEALAVVANVEGAEGKINALPDTITKSDEDAIKAAQEAYNALTDYEKSLVSAESKKALDDAVAALAELNKPADTTSPETGDNRNLWMWIAVAFISGGLLLGTTFLKKKDEIAE